MKEPIESDVHPFEHFKAVMRKLVTVKKSDLDARLKEHNATKPERKAGRKAKTKEDTSKHVG